MKTGKGFGPAAPQVPCSARGAVPVVPLVGCWLAYPGSVGLADWTCRWVVGECEHWPPPAHKRHPSTNRQPERPGDSSPAVDHGLESGRAADPLGLHELIAASAIDVSADPRKPR